MKIVKSFLFISTLTCVVLFLSSCMNAAFTGAQAVYSHHSLEASFKDHYIMMQAERAIYIDTKQFKHTYVSISCFNGIVLLTGQVKNVEQRRQIEQIVRNISGVKEIHNVIAISPRPSPLTQMSDTWITTKIKSKLIAMKDVDATQIKVITENGVVYLIGIVQPEEADIAVDIARTTEGVQQVVKVFSYIHISKTENEYETLNQKINNDENNNDGNTLNQTNNQNNNEDLKLNQTENPNINTNQTSNDKTTRNENLKQARNSEIKTIDLNKSQRDQDENV